MELRSKALSICCFAFVVCTVPVNAQGTVDSTALRLLEGNDRVLRNAQTLRGKIQLTRIVNGRQIAEPSTVDVWASKPGSFRVITGATPITRNVTPSPSVAAADTTKKQLESMVTTKAAGNGQVMVSGEALEALMAATKPRFREIRLHTPGRSVSYSDGQDTARALYESSFVDDVADNGLQAFFSLNSSRVGTWTPGRADEILFRSLIYEGKELWDGRPYNVVRWVYQNAFVLPADTIVYTTRFFIGDDSLIHRSVTTSSTGFETERQFYLKLNPTIPPVVSSITNPKLVVIPRDTTIQKSLIGRPFVTLSSGAKLLDGGPFTLNKLLGGKKAALIWLWASGCASCTQEFPIAEKWLRDMGYSGVAVAALDYAPGDEDNARKMRSFNRATMPIAFGANSWTEFMINNGAAFVVLDDKGKVVYQGGFDRDIIERTLRASIPSLSKP